MLTARSTTYLTDRSVIRTDVGVTTGLVGIRCQITDRIRPVLKKGLDVLSDTGGSLNGRDNRYRSTQT